MLYLPVLIYISFLQTSSATPIPNAKPKPVELKYSCLTPIPADQEHIPDDVPIILLHGLSGIKESWHGILQLLALETKKKVCVADLRNHGESPWNDKEFDVEAMTEDIKHLIERLKAEKAIIIGHSLGGKIAVHLALNYPERVEKIIIGDMRPNGIAPEAKEEVQFIVKMLKELDKFWPQGVTEIEVKEVLLELINGYIEKINPAFKLNDPNFVPIKCSDGKCQWNTNPVLFDSVLKSDEMLNESSGHFDGPALFIYGGKSNFKVRDDESNIKKLFPNGKLVEVAEARHDVQLYKKFTREVIKFLKDE